MNGWIILDKPSGITSRQAGGRLRRFFGSDTFGHIGTLDPMASGLLPIALGQATKVIPYFEAKQDKQYIFSVKFGFETDTLDITGEILKSTDKFPTKEQILQACKTLTGDIEQIPPNYSAISLGGVRAYKMARLGKDFEIPARRVRIESLELIKAGKSLNDPWEFLVNCSSGTYVRSLGRDIAVLSGSLGTVDMIRRTKTSGFDIKNAVKLDLLENLFHNSQGFKEYLKPIDFGLEDILVQIVSDKDAEFLKNGGFVGINQADGLVRMKTQDSFIGIGVIEKGLLKPRRIIT